LGHIGNDPNPAQQFLGILLVKSHPADSFLSPDRIFIADVFSLEFLIIPIGKSFHRQICTYIRTFFLKFP